jgi:hypothetical protein
VCFSMPLFSVARWMKGRAGCLTVCIESGVLAVGSNERFARGGHGSNGALEGLEAGCRFLGVLRNLFSRVRETRFRRSLARPGLVGPFVLLPLVLVVVVVVGCVGAAPAFAASPWWGITTGLRPAELPPEGEGTLIVQAVNVGDGAQTGKSARSRSQTSCRRGVKVHEEEFEG